MRLAKWSQYGAWLVLQWTVISSPASAVELGYVLKSKIRAPRQWSKVRRADPNHLVDLSVGLKNNRMEDLEHRLSQISNPAHSQYRRHLTARELDDLIRPSADSVDLVRAWLAKHRDIQQYATSKTNLTTSSADDWIFLESVSLGVLESLFQTEYYEFLHQDSGDTIIRSLEWSLPADLADHVEIVHPANAFSRPRSQSRYGAPIPEWEQQGRLPTHEELVKEDLLDRGPLEIPTEEDLQAPLTVNTACNRLAISPLCLRVLYGTYGYQVQAPEKHSIGIVNFLGEVANRSDVQLYLEKYRKDAAAAGAAHSFKVETIAGADDQQTPNSPEQMRAKKGYEGALDAQTVLGISWPVPMETMNVGGMPPFHAIPSHSENTNEPYLAWLRHLKTRETLPSVISISYAEDEKTVPPEYARRVCAEFAQLGARGVSVLVASGDDGVGKDAQCVGLDEDAETRRFMPTFPASCPYVTAVGSTRFLNPEMVAFDARTHYSSAGGFSDVFDQPVYQRKAAQEYLARLRDNMTDAEFDTFSGMFNPNGRGFPDVSAAGYHYSVLWNATAHLQDGTSASTPTVAAIVALMNDALAAEGKPSMGFLNPWLYTFGHAAFKDVTIGSNYGCNSTGFPALEGWDPVTGFGTPWFPNLRELALQASFRSTLPWYYH